MDERRVVGHRGHAGILAAVKSDEQVKARRIDEEDTVTRLE